MEFSGSNEFHSVCCYRKSKLDLWQRRSGGSISDKLMLWKDLDISSTENGMLYYVKTFSDVSWLYTYMCD